MPKVTFREDGCAMEVDRGTTILEAALTAGVHVISTCGGAGTCGKCKVAVLQGEVDGGTNGRLSPEEAAAGLRLACTAQVTGDVVVSVPAASRMTAREPHPAAAIADRAFETPFPLRPPVRRVAVRVTPPTVDDPASDCERLLREVARACGLERIGSSLEAVRSIPRALRDGDWSATVLLVEDGAGGGEVVSAEAGELAGRQYAVAVDLGTTTVVSEVIDLVSGLPVARGSEYNRQAVMGADVISRIIATERDGGLERLRVLATDSVEEATARALEAAGVAGGDVVAYYLAGNTVMTHLFLGLDPATIRTEPYVPAASSFPWMAAAEWGLSGSPGARLYVLPCPASYVGGDITAGTLASGLARGDELSLLIDIGTNGEIVLGDSDWRMACSCSAGPAFEGGGVLHGMRATDGAIESVVIDPDTLEPRLATVGGASPVGVCGSGLIDTLAELSRCGAVDGKGAFDRELGVSRIRPGEHGWEYVLAFAEETEEARDIVLTEVDIENLLRAKAAVFAGVRVLLGSVGIDVSAIQRLFIAGSFGRYLDLDQAVAIGLLPDLPEERFSYLGNGSLLGAREVAMSMDALADASGIARSMTYVELSVGATFMDEYVSGLFLPHTDASLFPSCARPGVRASIGGAR
ncbi:MAG: DUF4445 domain-containing protein [Coriobacteriia bacterium]|nr:DUF4445 domain-containing protein [Coriobacteriia bacterium]